VPTVEENAAMPMNRTEIFTRVKNVVVEALGVDDDEVTEDATLIQDLGAESIDFLDIVFRLEKDFGIKIPKGDLFPEDLLTQPEFVENGKLTAVGLDRLQQAMPHADFSALRTNPDVSRMTELFTVGTIVNYVQSKTAA
jgi:acyl carrier protein